MISKIIPLFDVYDHSKCGVYKLFSTESPTLIYVGSTRVQGKRSGKNGFSRRMGAHLFHLKNGRHHATKLQAIANKYGLGTMRMQIIELCTPEECRVREQFYIDNLKPDLNTILNAFNSTGYKHTQQSIDKMSAAGKGRHLSAETRKKLSDHHKGKMPKNIAVLRSPSANKKRSESLTGRIVARDTRLKMSTPILKLDLKGNQICAYESFTEAALLNGMHYSSISKALTRKNGSAGGFKWARQEGYSISRLAK